MIIIITIIVKDKGEFWSSDCIVKERCAMDQKKLIM